VRSLELTEAVCRAAGTDAGNRSMKRAGRTRWSEADFAEASRVYFALAAELEYINQLSEPERAP
jgi:hypothetical protein